MSRQLSPLFLVAIIGSLLWIAPADGARVHASLTAETDRPLKADGVIRLHLKIDDGIHAQSHTPLDKYLIPMNVTMDATTGVTFDPPAYPEPVIENNLSLGKMSVYIGVIEIDVPYRGATPDSQISGTLRFQACDAKACFPPQTIAFTATGASTRPASTSPSSTSPASAPVTGVITLIAPAGSIQILGHDLAHDAYVFAFAAAFLVGIVFNVMPCVLPVVPLKIMGFYEVSQHDRRKSLLLGATFSAGLIASFGVLGVLIAALHVINWGGLFQQTGFTAGIVVVLVLMSFSLFGFFTVGLPTGVYRFAPRHDTYSGNFLFGILTAALSTPCTFGMFVGLLTWALSQPAAIGVALIMMVGVGMAFPYLVLSAFPELARNFPRTGEWADVVKQMMGFLLLATAVYFAQPLLARFCSIDAFWWAMFAVIALGAVFLVVRAIQITDRLTPRILATSFALLATSGSFWGAATLTSRPYEWVPYSTEALATARAGNRPVLIDFTATWCANCHYLEGFVLKNRRVVRTVKDQDVLMIQADVTDENALAGPLLKQLNPASSIPLTVVYLPHSETPRLLNGIYSVNDLLEALTPSSTQNPS